MAASNVYPPYCCAILQDECGQFILEQRGADAKYAAGTLTCFGGAREDGEEPLACMHRELTEELTWVPSHLYRVCDLYVDGVITAWFFTSTELVPALCVARESGRSLQRIAQEKLENAVISPWHKTVLRAFITQTRVDGKDWGQHFYAVPNTLEK